jgi:tetratricopeptide (TPR) repeat protein
LMAKANRLDDAIALLEKGIAVPGITSISSLYQSCAELMAKANRLDDAIKLLEKGIAVPGITNIFSLYQSCAELMAKANRLDDAIALLEKGIAVPGITSICSLYQSCAELMAKANRLDDAITLLEEGIAVVPASQRFILYQAELEILGRGGDCPRAERVLARGLAATPASNNRYKIAETGIRVLGSCGGADAVERLMGWGSPSQLDPPQRVLANYSLAHLSGDWQKAFEIVHKGREEFPSYVAIRSSEADALVALGRSEEAYAALSQYEAGLHRERDNQVLWLKSFVALAAGRPEEARSLAAMFGANDFNPSVALDEAEMLRLWAVSHGGAQRPLSNSFPGIAEYRRGHGAKTAATGISLTEHPPKRPCILAVATEWDSRHGGLSTFNRDLCAALAPPCQH